jgi:hypothetical protein
MDHTLQISFESVEQDKRADLQTEGHFYSLHTRKESSQGTDTIWLNILFYLFE